MKSLKIITALGGTALVVLGVGLAWTNPGKESYEEYAVEKLSTYLKDEVCTQTPKQLEFLNPDPEFLKRQCQSLVDTGRPQIQQIIEQQTERQNWVIFSIYRTDINISPLLPAYHFETVGVLQQFLTYQAQQQ